MLQKSFRMPKVLCYFERPPNSMTGHSIMVVSRLCGVVVASFEGGN